jgi:Zn-dependent M28 family amino/carboxypeptidase
MVADIEFMQGNRHHLTGPAHLEATREYVEQQMTARGLPVERQVFNRLGTPGANIIATLEAPTDNGGYYIIDGHFDTFDGTPGADDNASGTAGMLEAMRVLSQFNSEYSIEFIGFDQEEFGLLGSRYYVDQLSPGDSVLGLINFEMIGYTCTDQPECAGLPLADTAIYNISSESANTMSDTFVAVGATHVPGLKIVSSADDDNPDHYRSDHAPFWTIGVDALMLSDGANFRTPHYHQGSDVIDHLDLEFMTRVVKTAVGTLVTVAGVTHTGAGRSDSVTLE